MNALNILFFTVDHSGKKSFLFYKIFFLLFFSPWNCFFYCTLSCCKMFGGLIIRPFSFSRTHTLSLFLSSEDKQILFLSHTHTLCLSLSLLLTHSSSYLQGFNQPWKLKFYKFSKIMLFANPKLFNVNDSPDNLTHYCKLVKVQTLCILCNNWCLFVSRSSTPDLSLVLFIHSIGQVSLPK